MKALVWAVVTHGCESWAIKKRDEKRIEDFEMKCKRKILRVSWTQKNTNEWVLETAGVERDLLNFYLSIYGIYILINRRKLAYFGHVMRKERDCLEKEVIQGAVPGGQRCDGWTTWKNGFRCCLKNF